MARRYKTSARVRKAQRTYRTHKKAYSSYTRLYERERERWEEELGLRLYKPMEYKKFTEEGKTKVNKYITYLKQYRERRILFEDRGLDFHEDTPYTFVDWSSEYATKLNDLKLEVKHGERKSIGSVNRELVSDQAYELSQDKASVIADYLFRERPELIEKLNYDFRVKDPATGEVIINPDTGKPQINLKKRIDFIMKLRQGSFVKDEIGLWNLINKERERLFNLSDAQKAKLKNKFGAGTIAEAVAKEIGQTFFDSEL